METKFRKILNLLLSVFVISCSLNLKTYKNNEKGQKHIDKSIEKILKREVINTLPEDEKGKMYFLNKLFEKTGYGTTSKIIFEKGNEEDKKNLKTILSNLDIDFLANYSLCSTEEIKTGALKLFLEKVKTLDKVDEKRVSVDPKEEGEAAKKYGEREAYLQSLSKFLITFIQSIHEYESSFDIVEDVKNIIDKLSDEEKDQVFNDPYCSEMFFYIFNLSSDLFSKFILKLLPIKQIEEKLFDLSAFSVLMSELDDSVGVLINLLNLINFNSEDEEVEEKIQKCRKILLDLFLDDEFIEYIVNDTEVASIYLIEIIFTYFDKFHSDVKEYLTDETKSFNNLQNLADEIKKQNVNFDNYTRIKSIKSKKVKEFFSENRRRMSYKLQHDLKGKNYIPSVEVLDCLENEIFSKNISKVSEEETFAGWHPKELYQLSSIVCVESFYNLIFGNIKYCYGLILDQIISTNGEIESKELFDDLIVKIGKNYERKELRYEYKESLSKSVAKWAFWLFDGIHLDRTEIRHDNIDFGQIMLYTSLFYSLGKCKLFNEDQKWWIFSERDNKLKLIRRSQKVIDKIFDVGNSLANYMDSLTISINKEEAALETIDEIDKDKEFFKSTIKEEEEWELKMQKSAEEFFKETEEEKLAKDKEKKLQEEKEIYEKSKKKFEDIFK